LEISKCDFTIQKGSRLEPTNYRGISLTSIVGKIMETFVRYKLEEHFAKNKLLNQCQHGFTKNKSCVTNLLETIDTVTSELAKGNQLDIAFIDFAKAFDVVPHA
jgi:hypothetical protein